MVQKEETEEKPRHITSPKKERERKVKGVPRGKSKAGHEGQSERTQEKQSGRHHSTWSGKRRWRNRREKENGINIGENQLPWEQKVEKTSDHVDDTTCDRPSI